MSREVKEIKKCYIYSDIYYFWCSLFSGVDPIFIWYYFPSAWSASFDVSCSAALLVVQSFKVYLKKPVLLLFIYFWRAGKGGRERGRETSIYKKNTIGFLLHTPSRGPGPPPRREPWPGTRLVPSVCGTAPNPLSHTSPDSPSFLFYFSL